MAGPCCLAGGSSQCAGCQTGAVRQGLSGRVEAGQGREEEIGRVPASLRQRIEGKKKSCCTHQDLVRSVALELLLRGCSIVGDKLAQGIDDFWKWEAVLSDFDVTDAPSRVRPAVSSQDEGGRPRCQDCHAC